MMMYVASSNVPSSQLELPSLLMELAIKIDTTTAISSKLLKSRSIG